jgi:hypothetical protein
MTRKKIFFSLSVIILLSSWKFLLSSRSEHDPGGQVLAPAPSSLPQIVKKAPSAAPTIHHESVAAGELPGEKQSPMAKDENPAASESLTAAVEYTEAFRKKADLLRMVAPCSYPKALLKEGSENDSAMAQRFIREDTPQRLLECSKHYVQHAFYSTTNSEIFTRILPDDEVYDNFLASIPAEIQPMPSFDIVNFVNLTSDHVDIRVSARHLPPDEALQMSYVVSWLKDETSGTFHLAAIERE